MIDDHVCSNRGLDARQGADDAHRHHAAQHFLEGAPDEGDVVSPIERARERGKEIGKGLPAIALVFALLGWIFDSGWMLLILPSATQAAFGVTFLRSLNKTPLVEHFARMVKPELAPPELAHCRSWTGIWGVYLIVLAVVGLGFARFATLGVWTLYTGIVSYALIGALFAVAAAVIGGSLLREAAPAPARGGDGAVGAPATAQAD